MLNFEAFLERWPIDFTKQAQRCTIERIVTLPDREYKDFRAHPTTPRTFVAENTDCMYEDSTGTHHCLLVLGDASSDGIAVEIVRRSYYRYMVLIPGARELVHSHLNTFANLLLQEVSQSGEEGKRTFTLDDIQERYGVRLAPDNGIGSLFLGVLRGRQEVADAELTVTGLRISCHPELLLQQRDVSHEQAFNAQGRRPERTTDPEMKL